MFNNKLHTLRATTNENGTMNFCFCFQLSGVVALLCCTVYSAPLDGYNDEGSQEKGLTKVELYLRELLQSGENTEPYTDPFSSNEGVGSKIDAILTEALDQTLHRHGRGSRSAVVHDTSAERIMNHILDEIHRGHVSEHAIDRWTHDLHRLYIEGKIDSEDLKEFINKMHESLADTPFENSCCPFGK